MLEPASSARRRWQFPFRVLLILPIACAPAFYLLAMNSRHVGSVDRSEQQSRWFTDPRRNAFLPQDGERVAPDDMLVAISHIDDSGPYLRLSLQRLLLGGKIDFRVRHLDDFTLNGSADPKNLARLPALLKALPPSDRSTSPTSRVLVAFQDQGRWVVRSYRSNAKPKEVEDLAKALQFREDDRDRMKPRDEENEALVRPTGLDLTKVGIAAWLIEHRPVGGSGSSSKAVGLPRTGETKPERPGPKSRLQPDGQRVSP